ncbi:MAG: carbohydrate ABC transporter permease, partial [Anaerolineae bacterium]|nr:carbohydrate ABC transporter permease [Thermoflexales bacterium]MDW8408955.1 carbohydrate ABC transporter permease [Anaerolineae bacterium]
SVSGVLEVILAALLALFFSLPVLWMTTTALKTTTDTFAIPPVIFFQPTLEHFKAIYEEGSVFRSLVNSVIVASLTTALSVALGAPAAYVLARFEFHGKSQLWFWIISNRFISPIVVALPFFLIARNLAILDSHLVLILVYMTFGIPLVVWLCVDQFRAVPREVDEASRIDGANLWQTFLRINLPLAAPGIIVSAIMTFITSWNELLFALVLTRTVARTAPVEAANFMTGFGIRWGPMMATGTLIVLPVLVFAIIVSRNLVRGLTIGAVK